MVRRNLWKGSCHSEKGRLPQRLLVCLAIGMAFAIACLAPTAAMAASVSSVTGVTLGQGYTVCTTATVDQTSIKRDSLAAIKKWRQDALSDSRVKVEYSDGVYLTVAEYLKKAGMSTEEYLNPSWSNALEHIAVQRVIEGFDYGHGHTRQNDESCWTASYNGAYSGGECLAWGTANVYGAVEMWASEKGTYLQYYNDESKWAAYGHYYMLIHPNYRSYGLAYSYATVCAEASHTIHDNTDQWGLKGTFSFEINVTDKIMQQGITTDLPSEMTIGASVKPTVKLNYTESSFGGQRGFTAEGTWTSSNSSILSVSSDGTITASGLGTAKLTFTCGDMKWDYTVTVTKVVPKPMYRLYNRWSGEHLFTMNKDEVSNLVSLGWKDEGVAWQAPSYSDTPVYRLYNPYSGDHFYTSNVDEYNHLGEIGWNKESISFYSASSSTGKPIYRLFNRWLTQGTHLFTTNASEYSYLGSIGWNKEGVAFYGL